MATTFTWTYPRNLCLTENGHTNVVKQVFWKCEGTDGTNTHSFSGVAVLSDPGDPFVEFNELTYQVVDGWVKARVGFAQSVENAVQEQLDRLANPPAEPAPVDFPF